MSKIQCLWVNDCHQLHDCSIRCSGLQTEGSLHYHTTEIVVTFISQHIWIIISLVLGILIIIIKFRTWKNCMRICISDGEIDDFRTLSCGSVTGWGGWCAGQRGSRLWSWLSASVGWRCTSSFASPACQHMLCSAILARKAAGRVVLRKHCRHHCMAALTCSSLGNSTPRLFCCRTSVWCFLMWWLVSSIGASETPSLGILAIFTTRRMSECSSCTRPPSLPIVADIVKTNQTIVVAFAMNFGYDLYHICFCNLL